MIRNLSFSTVPADDTVMWRYMDFAKFMSLLENESVFFLRGDLFVDKYEGTVPKQVIDNLSFYKADTGELVQVGESLRGSISNVYEMMRGFVFINCWHMNNIESAAMWDLYAKRGNGIAIRTTFGDIKKSFSKSTKDIIAAEVKYIDYSKDNVLDGTMISPFIYKRKSFEHEREFRLIVSDQLNALDGKGGFKEASNNGLSIDICLEHLIKSVYISPNSEKWFEELVDSLVRKYNIKAVVIQSSLYEFPS
ncbi:DUF2971 domain-containing protein [Psychrobacillus vulpis]|uniref:DUF2971 domain-containing protein n=1 Tax=Psychrobacillus vulpis TaxID=2325572 RepID=A0A544TFV3_9BACI|nr:DUF2971 domain-containing protein [Psychrobacillus vulpis]TQR16329.1 DUF2971 domain-containing protein [Psychrobacillus vulpis]